MENTPSDETLINKILEYAEMDKLIYILKQTEECKFAQSWKLFYNWLSNRKEAEK